MEFSADILEELFNLTQSSRVLLSAEGLSVAALVLLLGPVEGGQIWAGGSASLVW